MCVCVLSDLTLLPLPRGGRGSWYIIITTSSGLPLSFSSVPSSASAWLSQLPTGASAPGSRASTNHRQCCSSSHTCAEAAGTSTGTDRTTVTTITAVQRQLVLALGQIILLIQLIIKAIGTSTATNSRNVAIITAGVVLTFTS